MSDCQHSACAAGTGPNLGLALREIERKDAHVRFQGSPTPENSEGGPHAHGALLPLTSFRKDGCYFLQASIRPIGTWSGGECHIPVSPSSPLSHPPSGARPGTAAIVASDATAAVSQLQVVPGPKRRRHFPTSKPPNREVVGSLKDRCEPALISPPCSLRRSFHFPFQFPHTVSHPDASRSP
jgi:hypothetical protein